MKAIIYSRPDCHLCQEALGELARLATEFPELEVEEIDIESDDGLFRRYLERIPVIEIGGEIASELVFDAAPVRARLLNA